jgi:hypothetical protein
MKKIVEVVVALLFILGSIWIVQKTEDDYAFLDWRYRLHRYVHNLSDRLKGKTPRADSTIIVLIGDEEFWKGSYAGRTPVNKSNLAALIRALADLKPRVIALDFNFSAPTIDGSLLDNEVYQPETRDFVEAVRDVSSPDCTIVLTKFLHPIYDPDGGYYVALPNRFDRFQPEIKDAKFGYINLPYDFRFIPLTVVLGDGTRLESFSEAIVRSFDLTGRKLDIDQDDAENYCGTYLDEGKFVVRQAADIVGANKNQINELKHSFAGKIVIVGAGWSVDAAADPREKDSLVEKVDSRYTPAGTMAAVFLHANWVESILADRTGKQFPKKARWIIEFSIGLIAFLLFRGWIPGINKRPRMLLTFQIIYFPAIVLLWLLVSYFFFLNLGLFIDPLPGLVGALLALGERVIAKVLEWRKMALQHPENSVTT